MLTVTAWTAFWSHGEHRASEHTLQLYRRAFRSGLQDVCVCCVHGKAPSLEPCSEGAAGLGLS